MAYFWYAYPRYRGAFCTKGCRDLALSLELSLGYLLIECYLITPGRCGVLGREIDICGGHRREETVFLSDGSFVEISFKPSFDNGAAADDEVDDVDAVFTPSALTEGLSASTG